LHIANALQTFESQNNTKSSSTHKEHCAFTSSDSFPSVLRHCWLGASCRHSSARVREHGGPCKMFPSPSLVTVQNLVTAAKNSVLQVSLNGASLYLTLPYLTLPFGAGVLPPCAEASSGPNAHPRINPKVIETFCRLLQT